MTGWLTTWNEPHRGCPATAWAAGMMGEDDMKKLDAAQGTEAAKLFLTADDRPPPGRRHDGPDRNVTRVRTPTRFSSARTS